MKELIELYRLAEEENIAVDCFELKKREALSVMDEDGACSIAIDPFKLRGEVDEKMKLAHELGHCMTGSFYNEFAACDVREKHEKRAEKWAVEKLVTPEALDEAAAEGYIEPWEMAERLDMSENMVREAVCWYRNGNLDLECACGG